MMNKNTIQRGNHPTCLRDIARMLPAKDVNIEEIRSVYSLYDYSKYEDIIKYSDKCRYYKRAMFWLINTRINSGYDTLNFIDLILLKVNQQMRYEEDEIKSEVLRVIVTLYCKERRKYK